MEECKLTQIAQIHSCTALHRTKGPVLKRFGSNTCTVTALLHMKVGMVIMLLNNFDQQNRLCSGSRYITEQILTPLFVATSLIGVNAGRTLLIPRINLIPSDNIFPFTVRRFQ
ncbi:hypothetical protein NL108_013085 [Boleophthalmus pectinirostris]|nr:hypothetical protein NL108_013085 [Boleophthalmus pectinirostris]